MIRDFVRWLKGVLLGSDDEDTSNSDTETDFDEYTLYEIGDYMCRRYDDGIPSFDDDRAKEWGDYSMDVILREKYHHVEQITPEMIEQLDQLLSDVARGETEFEQIQSSDDPLLQGKVEDFRRAFFDQFSDEQINSVLIEMYHDAREDFQLDSVVRETRVDSPSYEFRIADPEPASISMEGDAMPMNEMNVETKSVEMENVRANLDLVRNPIGETIEDMVGLEAKMLWAEIDVDAVDLTYAGADGVMDSILESMLSIKEENFVPDTVVKNGYEIGISPTKHTDVPTNTLHGCDILTDETGVMDVPFIVADSDYVGHRVTYTPPEIRDVMGTDQYRRRLVWKGNYVVTNDDAVCGPK